MRKVKYYYNTQTLRYEKHETPLRVKLLRIFGFAASVLATGLALVMLSQKYFPTSNEKKLQQENKDLHYSYRILESELDDLNQRLIAIEKRDNTIYRSFFESDPVEDSARARTLEQLAELKKVQSMGQGQLIASLTNQIQVLHNRIRYQKESFDKIEELVENKNDLLEAIPAIQPVSNQQLERIASGYGVRIDPVYKIPKMHKGLDFTAPTGTPIYATANGRIDFSGSDASGYGNHVIIDHGFGYKTLYAHMTKIKSRRGQKIKRGEVIGWVGSTGKSTGPHLHYEVIKNGTKVDPVYFFYNDLSPEQYARVLQLASSRSQSYD